VAAWSYHSLTRQPTYLSFAKTSYWMRDLRLPPRCQRDLHLYGMLTQQTLRSFRRFGATYLFHIRGSSRGRLLDLWRWDLIGYHETSANNYQSTLRNIPEERIYNFLKDKVALSPPTDLLTDRTP